MFKELTYFLNIKKKYQLSLETLAKLLKEKTPAQT